MARTLFVRDDASLARLVDEIAGVDVVGLDTEFLRERTYYPKLCLVQLATADLLAAVDPLACRDLGPLYRFLASGPEVVLHAAQQDLEILAQQGGEVPERLFDTQIAAAFLGYGYRVGQARLVEAVCGVSLGRSAAYTDWARRPLDPDQVVYALDDVRHLLECRDRLHQALVGRGRLEWAEEEFERLLDEAVEEVEPRRQWKRVSGAQSLRGEALSILRELAAWREEEAMRRDEPRQRILPDRALVALARRPPKNEQALRDTRGVHPNEAKRSGSAILEALQRGKRAPQEEWPSWGTTPRFADHPDVPVVATLMDAFLRARARDEDIASRQLGNRADLERIVRGVMDGRDGELAERVPLMAGWRRRLVGEDLLRLLHGEIALRVHTDAEGVAVTWEPQDGDGGVAREGGC